MLGLVTSTSSPAACIILKFDCLSVLAILRWSPSLLDEVRASSLCATVLVVLRPAPGSLDGAISVWWPLGVPGLRSFSSLPMTAR